jgi:hypothetical protein
VIEARLEEKYVEADDSRGQVASVYKVPSEPLTRDAMKKLVKYAKAQRKTFYDRYRRGVTEFMSLIDFKNDGQEARASLAAIDTIIGNQWPGMVTAQHALHLGVCKADLVKLREQFRREAKLDLLMASQGFGVREGWCEWVTAHVEDEDDDAIAVRRMVYWMEGEDQLWTLLMATALWDRRISATFPVLVAGVGEGSVGGYATMIPGDLGWVMPTTVEDPRGGRLRQDRGQTGGLR